MYNIFCRNITTEYKEEQLFVMEDFILAGFDIFEIKGGKKAELADLKEEKCRIVYVKQLYNDIFVITETEKNSTQLYMYTNFNGMLTKISEIDQKITIVEFSKDTLKVVLCFEDNSMLLLDENFEKIKFIQLTSVCKCVEWDDKNTFFAVSTDKIVIYDSTGDIIQETMHYTPVMAWRGRYNVFAIQKENQINFMEPNGMLYGEIIDMDMKNDLTFISFTESLMDLISIKQEKNYFYLDIYSINNSYWYKKMNFEIEGEFMRYNDYSIFYKKNKILNILVLEKDFTKIEDKFFIVDGKKLNILDFNLGIIPLPFYNFQFKFKENIKGIQVLNDKLAVLFDKKIQILEFKEGEIFQSSLDLKIRYNPVCHALIEKDIKSIDSTTASSQMSTEKYSVTNKIPLSSSKIDTLSSGASTEKDFQTIENTLKSNEIYNKLCQEPIAEGFNIYFIDLQQKTNGLSFFPQNEKLIKIHRCAYITDFSIYDNNFRSLLKLTDYKKLKLHFYKDYLFAHKDNELHLFRSGKNVNFENVDELLVDQANELQTFCSEEHVFFDNVDEFKIHENFCLFFKKQKLFIIDMETNLYEIIKINELNANIVHVHESNVIILSRIGNFESFKSKMFLYNTIHKDFKDYNYKEALEKIIQNCINMNIIINFDVDLVNIINTLTLIDKSLITQLFYQIYQFVTILDKNCLKNSENFYKRNLLFHEGKLPNNFFQHFNEMKKNQKEIKNCVFNDNDILTTSLNTSETQNKSIFKAGNDIFRILSNINNNSGNITDQCFSFDKILKTKPHVIRFNDFVMTEMDQKTFKNNFFNFLNKDCIQEKIKMLTRIEHYEEAIKLIIKEKDYKLLNNMTIYASPELILEKILGSYDIEATIEAAKILQRNHYDEIINQIDKFITDPIQIRIFINKALNKHEKVLFYMNRYTYMDEIAMFIRKNNLYYMCDYLYKYNKDQIEPLFYDMNFNVINLEEDIDFNSKNKEIPQNISQEFYKEFEGAYFISKNDYKSALLSYIEADDLRTVYNLHLKLKNWIDACELIYGHYHNSMFNEVIEHIMKDLDYKSAAHIYRFYIKNEEKAVSFYMQAREYKEAHFLDKDLFLKEIENFLNSDLKTSNLLFDEFMDNCKRFKQVYQTQKTTGIKDDFSETTFTSNRSRSSKGNKSLLRNKPGSRYENDYVQDQVNQITKKINLIRIGINQIDETIIEHSDDFTKNLIKQCQDFFINKKPKIIFNTNISLENYDYEKPTITDQDVLLWLK